MSTASMLQEVEVQAAKISESAQTLEISNFTQYAAGGEILIKIKTLAAEIEEKFRDSKSKTHVAWKEVVAEEKKCLDPLKKAEKGLKAKIIEFADLQAQEYQERVESLQAQHGADVPLPAYPNLKLPGISFYPSWEWRMRDASLLPREFLIPDTKKISERVAALGPTAQIPGVEIYEEMTITARRAS